MIRSGRAVAVVVSLFVLSSCAYFDGAVKAKDNGTTPWWCTSTEEIPVTDGPAVGSVDYYAAIDKAPLTPDQCIIVSAQFDTARGYALQWPTAGAAVAAGWRMATPYVGGMGTHHIRGGITPQVLTAPTFDRLNPNLDAAGLDDVFDPKQPEVLQFDGNGPDAKLVGFDYYVRTDTGGPPAGFAGTNDWWHIHPWICFRTSDAVMVAFNTSDSSCTAAGGVNVNMANYYMLHVWILADMTFEPDVYAGMIPCITNGTAVHDPNDPCHKSRTMSGMSHDMSMTGL